MAARRKALRALSFSKALDEHHRSGYLIDLGRMGSREGARSLFLVLPEPQHPQECLLCFLSLANFIPSEHKTLLNREIWVLIELFVFHVSFFGVQSRETKHQNISVLPARFSGDPKKLLLLCPSHQQLFLEAQHTHKVLLCVSIKPNRAAQPRCETTQEMKS